MKTVDYLIIGGGVAGTTAAETLRQNDKNCTIAIVSDEPYRLYSRILLSKPYYFFGKIPAENIWLKKEEWYKENNVELLGGKTAVKLDRAQKKVTLNDGAEVQYSKLLLAVGGHARRWTVPGADKKGVCYLRVMDEMKDMIEAFKGAKHGITIGSGFVSFETVELMRKAGLDATVVMLEPYFWYPLFDEVSGKMIEKAMEKEGVKLLHRSEVAEVTGGEKVEGVVLKDGNKLPCEAIGVGIGLQYNFEWIKAAGLTVGRGINADEFLRTNDENIFTAGDCAEFNDVVLRERVMLGNWSNALTQGSVAAANMQGQNKPFKLVSYYTAQAFGLNIAMVGDVRVDEGKKVIARSNKEKNSYARIIVKGGKVEGATLLNCTDELFAISALIEKDVDVSGKETELSDPKFDIKSLTLSYVA